MDESYSSKYTGEQVDAAVKYFLEQSTSDTSFDYTTIIYCKSSIAVGLPFKTSEISAGTAKFPGSFPYGGTDGNLWYSVPNSSLADNEIWYQCAVTLNSVSRVIKAQGTVISTKGNAGVNATTTAVATTTSNGLMSAEDKENLEGILSGEISIPGTYNGVESFSSNGNTVYLKTTKGLTYEAPISYSGPNSGAQYSYHGGLMTDDDKTRLMWSFYYRGTVDSADDLASQTLAPGYIWRVKKDNSLRIYMVDSLSTAESVYVWSITYNGTSECDTQYNTVSDVMNLEEIAPGEEAFEYENYTYARLVINDNGNCYLAACDETGNLIKSGTYNLYYYIDDDDKSTPVKTAEDYYVVKNYLPTSARHALIAIANGQTRSYSNPYWYKISGTPVYLTSESSNSSSSSGSSSSSSSSSTTQYTLSVVASPTAGGTVYIGTSGTTSKTVDSGTSVTVYAVANSGYTFTKWSDGGSASHSVTVNSSKTLTATFTADSSSSDTTDTDDDEGISGYTEIDSGLTGTYTIYVGNADSKITNLEITVNGTTKSVPYGYRLKIGYSSNIDLIVNATSSTGKYSIKYSATDSDYVTITTQSNGVSGATPYVSSSKNGWYYKIVSAS